ncbi:hypothetical protein ACQ4PT_010274 [Festuca glaucescens]
MSINRECRGGRDASVQHHKHPYSHKTTKMAAHQAPSLNHLAPNGEATPKEATPNGTPALAAGASHTLADHASSYAKRKDKQVMTVEEHGEEVQPIIVNMAKARGTARVHLLAVGVLLSVVAITSKQLINYMRNIWKVRGTLETNQYADKRFVIEFSEEGDLEHVICGGPWRYKDDDVLVRKLKEGEDPETAQFDDVPIWVQYKGIPFYLLMKALARDLGRRTGEFICIDNNARGDICDKILRARVLMPLGRPLLRGIPIEDEFTMRRSWFLPEHIGQERRTPSHSLPWRSSWEAGAGKMRTSETRHTAIVSHVVKRVEMLSMQDNEAANKNTTRTLMINDATANANTLTKNSNDNSLAKIVINSHTSSDSSSTPGLEPPEPLGASHVASDAVHTATLLPPTSPNTNNDNNTAKTKPEQDSAMKDSGKTAVSVANAPTSDRGFWKRRPIQDIKASIQGPGERATQGFTLGAMRQREEDNTDLSPVQRKKIVMQVPSMVDCLGEEGLRKLIELEDTSNTRTSFDVAGLVDPSAKNEPNNMRHSNTGCTNDAPLKTNDSMCSEDVSYRKEQYKMVRWAKPDNGGIKINVDARFWPKSKESTAGVVVRDHLGSVILAASLVGNNCFGAEEAEAKAICEGLKLAVEHNLNPNTLESDCVVAVTAINSSTQSSSRIWHIYKDISMLRNVLPNCAITNVGRSCNGAAHDLARLARKNGCSNVWLSPVPASIREMCNQDSVTDTLRRAD